MDGAKDADLMVVTMLVWRSDMTAIRAPLKNNAEFILMGDGKDAESNRSREAVRAGTDKYICLV